MFSICICSDHSCFIIALILHTMFLQQEMCLVNTFGWQLNRWVTREPPSLPFVPPCPPPHPSPPYPSHRLVVLVQPAGLRARKLNVPSGHVTCDDVITHQDVQLIIHLNFCVLETNTTYHRHRLTQPLYPRDKYEISSLSSNSTSVS